ncbi:MAG: hypothetical protein ACXWM8_00120 [Candidatus Limnocylindrales bacterium]
MMDPRVVGAALLAVAAAAWLAVTVPRWLLDFIEAPTWRKLLHAAGVVALCGWFAYWVRDSCWSIPTDGRLGIDGRIYYRAAQACLDGRDPWLAGVPVSGFRFDFAGPPPTVLGFAPLAVLPEDVFTAVWLSISVAAAVYTIHRLKRPMWWLLFPPLVQGVLVGNPQVLCLAVLLAGSDWLRALAIPLKAYAALPMLAERRWRALGILGLASAVSIAIWPGLWLTYAREFGTISDRITAQSFGGFSASRDTTLLVVTTAAIGVLALLDLRAAGWLSVPALWPSSQFFYSAFALPVMSPILAVGLAVDQRGLPAQVICVYAAWRLARRTGPVLWRRLGGAEEEDEGPVEDGAETSLV